MDAECDDLPDLVPSDYETDSDSELEDLEDMLDRYVRFNYNN